MVKSEGGRNRISDAVAVVRCVSLPAHVAAERRQMLNDERGREPTTKAKKR